jgi:beta-galactosidase
VDNGNAATTEPFFADRRTAFNGLALLIVRSENRAGNIHIVANSNGLAASKVEIRSEPLRESPATKEAHLK